MRKLWIIGGVASGFAVLLLPLLMLVAPFHASAVEGSERVAVPAASGTEEDGKEFPRRCTVTEKLRLRENMERAKFPRGKVKVDNCFFRYELKFPGRGDKFDCEVSFVAPDRMKRELKQNNFVTQMSLFDGRNLYRGMGEQGLMQVVSPAERALAVAELKMLSPAVSAMDVLEDPEVMEYENFYLISGSINDIAMKIKVAKDTFLPEEYSMDIPAVTGVMEARTQLFDYTVFYGINVPTRQNGYLLGMRVEVLLKRFSINVKGLQIP